MIHGETWNFPKESTDNALCSVPGGVTAMFPMGEIQNEPERYTKNVPGSLTFSHRTQNVIGDYDGGKDTRCSHWFLGHLTPV